VTVTAYRITRHEFAADIWTGAGARDWGGRWNSRGAPVVYAAQSRALAAMEQLVHLVAPRILKGFVVASIRFDDAQIQRVDPSMLPSGWNNPVAPTALREYGDDWIAAARYPVLAVPSAVIDGEWNYLINPAHDEFPAMPKSAPVPFIYDPRLA
jgi:RES domain-containing protein